MGRVAWVSAFAGMTFRTTFSGTISARSAEHYEAPMAKISTKATKEGSREADKEAAKPAGPAYWLFKTEPEEHSWEMQKARGQKGEPWTGVRNFVARNNMKAMQMGDLGFFYHTGEDKEVVGIVEVCALAHPDAKDDTGVWKCVDVRAVCDMPKPVTLAAAKANPKLASMALVRTARLSVQPVTAEEWKEVCRMGGLDAEAIAGK
jgi:predicted RNA-binding protein with PUA-like domain